MGTTEHWIAMLACLVLSAAVLAGCAANFSEQDSQEEKASVQLGAMRLYSFSSYAFACWEVCLTLTETQEGMSLTGLGPEQRGILDSLVRRFAPYLNRALRKVADPREANIEEGFLLRDLPAGTYSAEFCHLRDGCWTSEWPPQGVRGIRVAPGKTARVYLLFRDFGGSIEWAPSYEEETEDD